MPTYLDALAALGLPPTDPNTALALGVTLRQVQRYAAGRTPPPRTVLLLLRMYVAHPTDLDSLLAVEQEPLTVPDGRGAGAGLLACRSFRP